LRRRGDAVAAGLSSRRSAYDAFMKEAIKMRTAETVRKSQHFW
jgi:hypothetical protein